jgi:hypothetical protein
MLCSDTKVQRIDTPTCKLRLILTCPASDVLSRCGDAGPLTGVAHVFVIIIPFSTKTAQRQCTLPEVRNNKGVRRNSKEVCTAAWILISLERD